MSRPAGSPAAKELENVAAAWVFRREAGLSPEEEAEFACWQAADPRHKAALARHDRAWSALDRPRQAGQADFLLERLAERASRRRRRRIGAISMGLVCLLAVITVWQTRRPSAADLTSRALVVMPEKQTLADGSVVELKSDAEIAVDFSGPLRRVTLKKGEAHFQVAKSDRPFVVGAGKVEFRAVGTAFAVQIAPSQVELLVTEGRVAVEKAAELRSMGQRPPVPASALPTALALVTAGNRMVVALEAAAPILAPTAVPPAEMVERLAWRGPKLEFTETPLVQAAALMNQYNRVQLVIEDSELRRLPVSGLFRANRTEAFVRLLEANFSVKAEYAGDTIRLQRRR